MKVLVSINNEKYPFEGNRRVKYPWCSIKYWNVLEIISNTKFTWEIHNGVYIPEAAPQRCSLKKEFWKYAPNLLENTHAEVWFQ